MESQLRASGLDRFVLVRHVRDGKFHQIPADYEETADPASRMIRPASLQAIAALPYVAQYGSFKTKIMGLRSAQGQREPTTVMMATDSLLRTLGLSGDVNLRSALTAGKAVIDPALGQRLGLHDGELVRVIARTPEEITLLTRETPREMRGQFRYDNDDFDIELAVMPLPLPAGFRDFDSAVLISPAIDARHDIGGPLVMVRFTPGGDPVATLAAFSHFVSTRLEAAAVGLRFEVLPLSAVFGAEDTLSELHDWELRLQTWILGAALAVFVALLFLNWPTLLRELALRRATGATALKACFRTAGSLVGAVVGVTSCATLLASAMGALIGAPLGWSALPPAVAMVMGPSTLLLICVGLAARRSATSLLSDGS
jgi:hypothetical protein